MSKRWSKLVLIGASCTLLCACGLAVNMCDDASNTVQREVAPHVLLDKYMLLKEMHAQLEKKQADIKVYDTRFANLKQSYTDPQGKPIPRSKWAREDREQSNMWEAEYAGIVASYNDLAAQYNAKMSEVNWRFTNVGDLPQGATEPLPREYAPYQVK